MPNAEAAEVMARIAAAKATKPARASGPLMVACTAHADCRANAELGAACLSSRRNR